MIGIGLRVDNMENKSDEIKALNTYYERANAEHGRIHDCFDQIDSFDILVLIRL